MNTPNPMFAKFDQILGKTTPTPVGGQSTVTSRADEIRALAREAEQNNTQSDNALSQVVRFGQNIIGDAISGAENLAKTSRAASGALGESLSKKVQGKPTTSIYQKHIEDVNKDKTLGSMLFNKPAEARDITTSKGVQQTLGDIGNAALTASMVGDVLAPAVKTGIKEGGKELIGKTANIGYKEAAKTGAKYGAGYGASGSAQEGDTLGTMALKTAESTALGAGLGLAGEGASKYLNKLINNTSSKLIDSTEKTLGKKLSQDQINNLNSFTESHIKTQLADSAKRLEQSGINSQELYNKYLNMEKGAQQSIHNNEALTDVGKEIGNAYNQVAKTRQSVGKQMGDILNKIGDEPVNVTDKINEFKDNISKNIGSFTESEKRDFEKLLQEGVPDTVKALTDYVQKIRNTFNELKSQRGVTEITNADRILSNYINGLSENINTQHPELGSIRDEYARLSGILKDGDKIVGKKTSNGEYRAVTSSAKSALTSLLNNGKKQFLEDLSNETGNPLLDKGLVAAQAMLDMGNKKGESLISSLFGEGVPSKTSLVGKTIDAAYNILKEKAIGTKPEITSKYLGKFKQ